MRTAANPEFLPCRRPIGGIANGKNEHAKSKTSLNHFFFCTQITQLIVLMRDKELKFAKPIRRQFIVFSISMSCEVQFSAIENNSTDVIKMNLLKCRGL